ncbi:MAG: alkaline phosphatase PhoX [Myxococcota bacterium]|nr:alkaline phosphatase PhoX [Myxococcota bacterium]
MAPHPSLLTRRAVVRSGLATLAALVAPAGLVGCSSGSRRPPKADGDSGRESMPAAQRLRSLIDRIGPLQAANADGIRLPAGFSIRIVARSGEAVLPDGHSWHAWPDGGATFATADGGWIYVSNSEIPLAGGAGALRFDAAGTLVDAYPILEGTNVNCAGGPTPWGTWLSCEEVAYGRVFETDPWGTTEAVERPALGRFKHEAATVDPELGCVYLSEDETDGRLYRFQSSTTDEHGHPSLTEGELQVAVVDAVGGVTWVAVPDPLGTGSVPTREQVPEATVFSGGEGIWWFDGTVYLSTKGDNRIWAYTTATQTIRTIYDRATAEDPDALYGVDNLTVSACGDVLVAEDSGQMRIVAVLPNGDLTPLVQIEGQDNSEITGPAFDPSGTRLYFSSQRATGLLGGITYEITGPFHEPLPDDEAC